MYDAELRRVKRILKVRSSVGLLNNREVYLFGVSDNTRQIIQILRELQIEPTNVIDNDSAKQNSYCSRLKVISFETVKYPSADHKLYIIYSAYWREMVPQLEEMGVKRRNIWRLIPKLGSILRLFYAAHRGKLYRNKLIEKYGNVPIFLCPYTGTGDVYLIGTFWEEYIRQKGIQDYVFIVITGACKKIASLFDIRNIELVREKKYAAYLITYYLYDAEKGKIKILNDCWAQVHTNQTEWFRGYKGLYFTQLFRKFVFDLPDDVKPQHPKYKDESIRVNEIFEKNELVKGQTIIISPYSNTLADLPEEFWEIIVKGLVCRGYLVGTNSGGPTEPAIKGSKELYFPLDIAPQVVEWAGGFIGIRSGLCDVISGTSAKKVILYDAGNRFYMGSAYEYFNLKDMELCDDALELEYKYEDINSVTEKVLNYFENVTEEGLFL